MKLKALFAAALIAQAALLAAPTAQALPTVAAPATQPADLPGLIRQLGDDDFHVRIAAADKLKSIGKPALPALEDARQSPDPEIHARAEDLIGQIEHPFVDLGHVPQATGYGRSSTSIKIMPDRKIVECQEPGRFTRIETTAAGIHMTVTGYLDGNQVTREFKANNAEHLRTMNAEAYALYQRLTGNQFGLQQAFQRRGNVVINGNIQLHFNVAGGQFQLQQPLRPPIAPPAQVIHVPIDPLDLLQNKVHERIQQNQADDPADTLVLPAAGRLGISAAENDNAAEQGVIVNRVQPDSRGAKLGLAARDIIQKANDQPIHSIAELRQALIDHPKGLVLEVLRDGKSVKLQE